MSDLLAKCDWDGDELRVELPQWPEVMTVWVNGKAMPFAPVTTDHKRIYDRCINRVGQLEAENAKLQAEIAELEGTIECLKGLAEANYERCDTCEAMLDCDECLRADASHKELRGLQAEIKALRELACHMLTCIRHMESPTFDANGCCFCKYDGKRVCNFEERMKALDIEAEE